MAKLRVKIADTPIALAHGLMHVKDLPNDEGMLFKFPSSTYARFWGKDTYIPLDLAFVADNQIVGIKKIVPMSTRTITSDNLCQMAIEANAGFFEKNGIKEGHRIEITENNDEYQIEFHEC